MTSKAKSSSGVLNGEPRHARRPALVGRAELLHAVAERLAAGHSVLLTGPTGIGKSALIQALETPGLTTIDPFERVTPARAARLRRSLDRGAVCVAAASARDRRAIGAAGRILWRFTTVQLLRIEEDLGAAAQYAGKAGS